MSIKKSAVQKAISEHVGRGNALARALEVLAEDAGSGGFSSVATIALLSALTTTGFTPGTIAFVESVQDYWSYAPTSVVVPDGITVAPASGGGFWLRLDLASQLWMRQAVWFVNTTTGNDENPGTLLLPIMSMKEFVRRTGQTFVLQNSVLVTITGLASGYAQTVVSNGTPLGSLTLTIRGQLAASVSSTLTAVVVPSSAAQLEPKVTPLGGWPVFTKKACLCHFPNAAQPSWAMAYDNDGTDAQITFPSDAATLPAYLAATMPLAGDIIEMYSSDNFARLEETSIVAISTHFGAPAVVLETLRFTACRLEGSILQSRCIWDSADSSVEATGELALLVCCVQEESDMAGYTVPRIGAYFFGCWFRFIVLVEGSAWMIDCQFNQLESVQCVYNLAKVILVQTMAGTTANYVSYFSIATAHTDIPSGRAFWGTPLSSVDLYKDASLYIEGWPAGGAAVFNPSTINVGLGGAALPKLVGGAVVPAGANPTTPALLAAAPFSGTAVEYALNCRISPS